MPKFHLLSIGVTVFLVVCFLVFAVFSVIRFIALWKLFKKAGVRPWRLLIPIGAYCDILELSGFHGLLCLLVLIPFFYIGGIIGWLMPVLLYRRFVGADQARAWKTLIPFYGAFLSMKIANDPACQYDGQRFVYKDQGIQMSSFTNQGQNFQQDWNNMQNQWQKGGANTQQSPMNFGQGAQNAQSYYQDACNPPVQNNGYAQGGFEQGGYGQTVQHQGFVQGEQGFNQQVYQQPAQSGFEGNAGNDQGFQFNDQTWTENDFRADQ